MLCADGVSAAAVRDERLAGVLGAATVVLIRDEEEEAPSEATCSDRVVYIDELSGTRAELALSSIRDKR
jgi:hypothetical protein